MESREDRVGLTENERKDYLRQSLFYVSYSLMNFMIKEYKRNCLATRRHIPSRETLLKGDILVYMNADKNELRKNI